MNTLPAQPDLDHLKKQAKILLREHRAGDPAATARFLRAIPPTARELRLHDAQSCIAREYGFVSWAELRAYVEVHAQSRLDRATRQRNWLRFVYSGDADSSFGPARPALAARMLAEDPSLAADDPILACAIGDATAVRHAIEHDPAWVDRPDGPLGLPPLVAVTHSSLLRLPDFRDNLIACARLLLDAGANPDQNIVYQTPPSGPAWPLSALYGAAGSNHDPAMTQLLLEAGADPNDNESLYHSLESPACTRLLLAHGAKIAGTNAMYRALDLESPLALELLLAHGGDPNELARNKPLTDWGTPLLWAIRRRRSLAHIDLLLEAGANPAAKSPSGVSAYRLALQFGLADVAARLERAGAAEPVPLLERFVAACACADEPAARAMLADHPDLPATLSLEQRRLLPDLVAEGAEAPARLMVSLGWPIATTGGDWDASALNHAVFRGDPNLTRFLLEHGAEWTEQQGFGDNVSGTLAWASCNEPVPGGDWPSCAQALLDHGMPAAEPDPGNPTLILIAGRKQRVSDDVREVVLPSKT